jgi:hypothetical protein
VNETQYWLCSRGHKEPRIETPSGMVTACHMCYLDCHEPLPSPITYEGLLDRMVAAANGNDTEAERLANELMQMSASMHARLRHWLGKKEDL